ncbi:MAG TPA: hypothetical protein VEH51_06520 [Burkholderiales bacterium]|nr:hypothetical protein [Burkholderiales bacterium]
MRIAALIAVLVLIAAVVASLFAAPSGDPHKVPPARQQFDRADVPWQAPPTIDPDNLRGF